VENLLHIQNLQPSEPSQHQAVGLALRLGGLSDMSLPSTLFCLYRNDAEHIECICRLSNLGAMDFALEDFVANHLA
jgi:hypothetical protein